MLYQYLIVIIILKKKYLKKEGEIKLDQIIQYLKDAGCSNKQIEKIMEFFDKGEKEKIYQILVEHRKKMLNDEHKLQKKIDCLDFFLYKIVKEENI